ncbi:MAG: hypothetical protein GX801_04475 [Fibrobacter sp.]|nr:hypothetical protein [Fibrobacter sp.]
MKKKFETPEQKLNRLNSGVTDVSSKFEENQSSLRLMLQKEIVQAKTQKDTTNSDTITNTPAEEPRSGWLPGPLSYPWILMFASVPKVIEQFLQGF